MIVKDTGGDFVPAPQGLHRAVCCDVIDLGVIQTKFGAKEKCRIVWQIEDRQEDGKPYLVSNMYTPSLAEKANLRKHLETWRGRPFTPEERRGFDLEVLVGVNCQLQIIHNTKDGSTYANVAAVVPAPKGAEPLQVDGYIRKKDRDSDSGDYDGFQATDEDVPF